MPILSAIKPLDIILAVFACQAGLAAPVLAVTLSGAGHGWVSPFFPSFGLLLAGPFAGVAWVWRKRGWGLLLGCALAVLFTVGDYLLWFLTRREGFGYFCKVWDYGPAIVVLWFSAWLYPQALLATMLGLRVTQWLGNLTRSGGPPTPPGAIR